MAREQIVDCHQSVAELSRQSLKFANVTTRVDLRAFRAAVFVCSRAPTDGYPKKLGKSFDAQ